MQSTEDPAQHNEDHVSASNYVAGLGLANAELLTNR